MNKKPTWIQKRDGRLIAFDQGKITDAISKAMQASGETGNPAYITGQVLELINQSPRKESLTVEFVQDLVELALIKTGYAKAAKAYIIYRKEHEKIRAARGTFVEVKKTMDEYLDQTDWRVFENSNADYSFSGLMSHVAGKIIANYTLTSIYSERVANAHRNADIHIHDLGYGVVGYCCGWSLKNLLLMGFGGVSKKIRSKPPKHLEVAIIQMVNFLGTMQMEHAGAQAFSSVDTLLAPFVKKGKLDYKRVKQNIQMLVFSLNVPSRWSCQAPFTNFTFDWKVPKDMEKEPAIVGGELQDFTYGDCQAEMDMINKAFIEVMIEGDADGRTFFYPIPTYNITRDFEWESENSKLLFEMTAKYGTPYFQNFVNSTLNPSDIRSMCCRLQLDLKQLRNKMGGLFGAADQTGSIGVVTINLPRIGYLASSKEDFFNRLGSVLDTAYESLEIKRTSVDRNLKAGLMPFTKKFLGSYRNHFSTIGINGMHEALLNFLGKGIETPEGIAFAHDVLDFIRARIITYQEQSKNMYNLEATPCESATYRFAKKDRELYPDIVTSGTAERPYYTNSTHLPVNYTDDVFDALNHQDELQCKYTGGTVLHGFIGERLDSWESAMKLVRTISYKYRLPYFTLTPTFSICPEHGYIKGEHFSCPYSASSTQQPAASDPLNVSSSQSPVLDSQNPKQETEGSTPQTIKSPTQR